MSDSDSEFEAQYQALVARITGVFQSSSDAGLELLSIIRSNPTLECAEALVTSTLNHAQASPRGVDALAVLIKALLDCLDTMSIVISEDEPGPEPFQDVFYRKLSEFLKDDLHETELHAPKKTAITPTNSTLVAALFSASALQCQLFKNHPATYGFARQGLQLPDSYREPERDEVVAIGVCLQLSVAGTAMIEDWLRISDGKEAVLQALKGLKKRRVIRFSGGLRLLDRVTEIAEGGFSQVISSEEAWNIIFPTTNTTYFGIIHSFFSF